MRKVLVNLSVAAMAMLVGATLRAADPPAANTAKSDTHNGTFVSAAGGKVVMTSADGKEHSHTVSKDCKFMIDGKAATLEAFKKGMAVSVTTDAAGNVTAMSHTAAPKTAATPARPAASAAKAPAAPATPAKTGK